MFLFTRPRRRSIGTQRRQTRRRVTRIEQLEDRAMLSILGQQLFPNDNPWNQKISKAPVASNSGAIINSIIASRGNGLLHPDMGQDFRTSDPLYGIPYNVVHGNTTPKVHVVIDDYADESDVQDAPIPSDAVLEGDLQNGPTVGVDNRGDSHLIVWDQDNNVTYEFYYASRPSENNDGQWHAAGEAVWDMKANTFRTLSWTSADAAGLPILPGLVRPDEALPKTEGGQGVIAHAIRFTLPTVLDQFTYPASHRTRHGNVDPSTQPPMGARFRLKSGVDISSFGPESRVIAQAMKDYGLILADNGSPFFFTGASYSVDADNNFALTWNNADDDIFSKTNGLESLHFSDFEVVDLTPVVTGLSGANGPAGTQVTVTGANFSGAAGRLQVLFGQVPATSVTVVDDSHVTAVAPAGSGTVHVRVQSGINDPDDPANLKSPIFGYGVSATSAADQFTYTATAGPIVTKVSAASGPVSGGSLVTVTGTSLADATAVRFGSAKARIKSKTATQIVVFSPPGKAGTVDVRVVSAIGTSPKSPADRFTYLAAPTITKLSRKSGSTSGGTMLTISGKNLANTVIVLFGTVPASIARAMAAQVVVYAPCGKAGTVDVRVVTAGGMSAVTSRDKFTYVYVRNSSAHALHPSLIVDIAKARAKKRGLAAGADPQIAAIGQWSERTYR